MADSSRPSNKKMKKSKKFPSSSWDADTAMEKLSVSYIAVTKLPPHDYMSILHEESMANIREGAEGIETDMVNLYRKIVEPCLDFHGNSNIQYILSRAIAPLIRGSPALFGRGGVICHSTHRGSNKLDSTRHVASIPPLAADHDIALVDEISGEGASDEPGLAGDGDDLLAFSDELNKCRSKLRQIRARLSSDKRWFWDYATSFTSMLRFVGLLMKMVQKCIDNKQNDEDAFRELFQCFANIFKVEMHLVLNTLPPLVIQGMEVASVPDLIYEKFPDVPNRSRTQQVNTVSVMTVAEVKRDARPTKSSVGSPDRKLPGCKRELSIDEDDTIQFPSKLCEQHACQLVKELPNTNMPNKKCMLGFVVQATKVRLTCLVMTEERRKLLESKDFEERIMEHDASIFYTRPYDMLSKEDRYHLLYIMVTLSKLTGDIQSNDH